MTIPYLLSKLSVAFLIFFLFIGLMLINISILEIHYTKMVQQKHVIDRQTQCLIDPNCSASDYLGIE